MSEGKYTKLGKNTLWMTIGTFSTRLLSFFMVPLYTSCLSTSEYGTSDLLTVTVSLLIPLLTVTAAEGVIRLTLDKEMNKSQVFAIATNLFFGGLLVLLVVSPFLLKWIGLQEYSVYFFLYYISAAFSSILLQFVKGLEHIRRFVFSGILSSATNIGCNILFLLLFKMGIEGYLLAMIIGNGIQILYLFFAENIWKYYMVPWKVDKRMLRVFLTYCIPLIPNSISWWISNSSDRYILSYFSGAAILGIYSVAYKIPSIVSVISNIFTGAWQISAVENFGDDESIHFFSNVYHKYSTLYVVGCSFVILFIKVLAKILFANEFYNAWPYAIILTFAAIFQAMGGFLGIIYGAAMKTREIFTTTMAGAIINIVLNFVLIPFWGAMGAAVSTLIGYAVVWFVRVVSSKKFLPIKLKWKTIGLSYLILTLQCIVTIAGIPFWYVFSVWFTISVILINRFEFIDIMSVIISKIKR